jgi:hypothetical protein
MDRYAASGQIAAVTPAPGDTALGVIASTLTRAKIHLFIVNMGSTGAVGDNVLQWLIRRFTALGTYTVVTPTIIDTGAPVAQLSAGHAYTAEPTYSTTLMDIAVHQRSVYQWNAAPGGELVIPATANNGIGFTPIHAAYVGPAQAVAHWME